jgi:cytochrome c556
MNILKTSLFSLIATAAFAASPTPIADIVSNAKTVQTEATALKTMLKSRQVDVEQVQQKTASLGETVSRMKQLVTEYEAANPSAAQTKAWNDVKLRIELIDVFHNNKSQLLSQEDVARNRDMLRAKADGIARRAAGILQAATSLN